MKEAFLHAIWKYKAFSFHNLLSDNEEHIRIIDIGIHNDNAGPDFLNATVKINKTVWHGHVEIHIKASDWFKHKHQHDEKYNSVILHVVYINDLETNTFSFPTISLCNRINPSFYKKYESLVASLSGIPCHKLLNQSVFEKLPLFLEYYFIERLEQKTKDDLLLLDKLKYDWSSFAYTLIMRAFGLSVNTYSFECLARLVSYKLIQSHRPNLFKIESLLFGTSGLLKIKENIDPYSKGLRQEYEYLAHKFQLTKPFPIVWKYSRMRPSGFPDLMIAFAASFFNFNSNLFNKIIGSKSTQDLYSLFDFKVSEYWLDHYKLGKKSKPLEKALGKTRKQIIILNAFIPLIYTYGQVTKQEVFIEKAVSFMNDLPAENNKIIRRWQVMNIESKTAAQSQALIHLEKKYCKNFKCLNCKIGHQVIFNQE